MRTRVATMVLAVMLSATLSGCASLPFHACPAGLHRAPTAQLYFGRNIGTAEGVSDADWARFLDEEVTPRFPEGLSVADAQGQWKGENGAIVRERSKALFLVLNGAPDEAAKIEALRTADKARFKQEAVLLIESTDCIGF